MLEWSFQTNQILRQRTSRPGLFNNINARINDSWSASWLNVKNHFRYDRNLMTYKVMNRLCPESLWDKINYNRDLFTQLTIRDTFKISRSLNTGLNLLKKSSHIIEGYTCRNMSYRHKIVLKKQLKTHLKS